MMNIYQIYSAVDNKDAYADLKQTDRKIIDFINYNEDRYTNEAIFIAQSGYTSTNIHQTDYVQTIPKMLLFSENFTYKLAETLKNELDFFPARLKIKDEEFKFFLGKIKLAGNLVDMENQAFMKLMEKNLLITRLYSWKTSPASSFAQRI